MAMALMTAAPSREPQPITEPSFLRARECVPPALMATTSVRPGGTVDWPCVFEPHATTVPSLLRARLWAPPAAIAMMLLRSGGTFV
jgi:hypothetical protein